LSVGGAEASQNGFGALMPQKSTLRSAMTLSSIRDRFGSKRPLLSGHYFDA
jgi:hypothetical protein